MVYDDDFCFRTHKTLSMGFPINKLLTIITNLLSKEKLSLLYVGKVHVPTRLEILLVNSFGEKEL